MFVTIKRINSGPSKNFLEPDTNAWDRPGEWAGDELSNEEHLEERAYSLLSPVWHQKRLWPIRFGMGTTSRWTSIGPTRAEIWMSRIRGDVEEAAAQKLKEVFQQTIRDAKYGVEMSIDEALRRTAYATGADPEVEEREFNEEKMETKKRLLESAARMEGGASLETATRISRRWLYPEKMLFATNRHWVPEGMTAVRYALETEYAYSVHGRRPPVYMGYTKRLLDTQFTARKKGEIEYMEVAIQTIEHSDHNRRSGKGMSGRWFWHRRCNGELIRRFPTGQGRRLR